jgi:cell division septal protein FtsQ
MQLAVYRSNRRRTARDRRPRLWLGATAALLVVATAGLYHWGEWVATGVMATRAFVIDSPYFSVREIKVRGGEKVGGSEIVAVAGLKHGMNIWKIDPAAIEKKIGREPWVRRVVVRREFPRRVVIDVEERIAKAIVAMRKLYYVDGDGVIFKEVGEGENVQFPLLTGLKPDELNTSDPKIRRRLQDAVRLGDLIAKDAHTLSEIHFDTPDRLVLYTVDYPVALHMGSGDWETKLRRLERVLSLWKGHEERLVSLDVSFRDQVVARLRRKNP